VTFRVELSVTSGNDPVVSPTGLGSGATRFSIIDAVGAIVQSQDVNGSSATFTGLADGTFTASAQLLDTAGAVLGDAVTTSFVDGNQVPTDPGQGDGSQPSNATYIPLASISANVTQE
jgi:hypothetical protein